MRYADECCDAFKESEMINEPGLPQIEEKFSHDFKEGDIVCLKSGSSKMVVIHIGRTTLRVMYSVFESRRIEEATTPAIALKKLS